MPNPQSQFIQAGPYLGATCESGLFTPDFQFAGGNGDLVKVFAAGNGQIGLFQRAGNLVTVTLRLITTTWTYTTAAGNLRIIGLPYAKNLETPILADMYGAMGFGGITKAGYTNFSLISSNGASFANIVASGSGQASVLVTAADMPSGTQQTIVGTLTYTAASQ